MSILYHIFYYIIFFKTKAPHLPNALFYNGIFTPMHTIKIHNDKLFLAIHEERNRINCKLGIVTFTMNVYCLIIKLNVNK